MEYIHLVAATYKNLAYSSLTHSYITKPVVLERLLDAALQNRGADSKAQKDMLLMK
jgi:hypothetical protein